MIRSLFLLDTFNYLKRTSTDLRSFKSVDYYIISKRLNLLYNFSTINFFDWMYFVILSILYKTSSNIFSSGFRVYWRIKQTSWFFYSDIFTQTTDNLFTTVTYSFLSGLKSFWYGIRFWVVGILLAVCSFYYLSYIRLLPFNKVFMEWFLIAMFAYWLLSGFVFFIKKYQYSKFTSAMQRFWKRSFVLFWLIEGFLFLVFFYLTVNSTSEPFYMYDQLKLYKFQLFSWRLFFLKLIPYLTLVIVSYFVLLSLKFFTFQKHSYFIFFLTLVLLYTVWLEFYQFFHIINFYGGFFWVFDSEELLWTLEFEERRTRLANNYLSLCMIAKFWHLIFIFLFWVFFVLRVNEVGRIRYPLMAANYQNFIILYILVWLYMYPWFKYVFRQFLDTPYYWFFTNARMLGLRVFFTDIKLFYYSFIFNFFSNPYYKFFVVNNFYYWIEASSLVGFDQYKKHIVRDYFISLLN